MALTESEWSSVQETGIKGPAGPGRYPLPVPNGWFAVAQSNDLGPGETKNAHYFGRDLVIWREHGTGVPHVVDAYCAHLGAHMGVGSGSPESHEPGPGVVHEDCLQCPFHGWRYDGTGACVEIPYSESGRIPSRARVRGYATVEKNGCIFAWHHGADEPPQWEIPDLFEFDHEEWEGPIYTERFISAALQELVENDQDTVHFVYVHNSPVIPEQHTRWEGRMRITEAPRPDGSVFSRETCQLGFVALRTTGAVTFMAASSPIDEGHVHQRYIFAYPKSVGADVGMRMVDAFAKAGVWQDIPIWEHKEFKATPILVKGDGEIAEFRRWASQFYTWPEGQAPRWAKETAGPE